VRKDQGTLVGWWPWEGIPAKCAHWDNDRYIFGTYQGYCASERVAGSSADFSDPRVEYIAPAAVNDTSNEITVTNSYQTADPVAIRSTNTVPVGLTANTTYFVIRVSATLIKLATSAANAELGSAIDITSQGVGTHSIVSSVAIDSYYTTNWINFGAPTYVKKLGKPAIILNAAASSANVTVSVAYDWVDLFQDEQTIAIGSLNQWGEFPWGEFVWGLGSTASPRNIATARRKVRSIRYKFSNSTINQDFEIQGMTQGFDVLRNRGNFA
jgi:hypothetical protein